MSAWLEYVVENKYLQDTADELGNKDNLHITICYFGRGLSKAQTDHIKLIVNKWVKFFPKRFEIKPWGFEWFRNELVVQKVIVPNRIYDIRRILLTELFFANLKWHNDYDWNPHVTLGKATKLMNLREIDPITVKKVWFHNDYNELDTWSLE